MNYAIHIIHKSYDYDGIDDSECCMEYIFEFYEGEHSPCLTRHITRAIRRHRILVTIIVNGLGRCWRIAQYIF